MIRQDLKDLGLKCHMWRDKRVVDHCKRMSKPNPHVIHDDRIASVLEAQGFVAPFAPRSVFDPDQLYAALAKYAPTNAPRVRVDEHVKSGIALAYKVFAKPKNEPVLQSLSLSLEDVDLMTTNKRGSSGLTAFGIPKRDAMDIAISSARRILLGEKVPEPCVCFARTQFGGKTRLVWGYPYSLTVLEGIFARPLISRFLGTTSPMAFGVTSGSLGARLRNASEWNRYAYSMDMSSFDSSVASMLIEVAFDIIATWFDMNSIEPISGKKLGVIYKRVRKYFQNTPIVMPDQQLYVGKHHGVPSGSYFTQFVDSIVNVIFVGATSSKFHLNVPSDAIFVLGDDALFWSDHLCSLDEISRYAKRVLGLNVHGSEKSEIVDYDQPVHFLGRKWVNGFPTIDEGEILARAEYPERFRTYSKDPTKAKAQVQMMMLSLASTYREGWRIARRCYGNTDSRYRMAFLTEKLPVEVDYESSAERMLTGYPLYKLRERQGQYMKTTVATQYWL